MNTEMMEALNILEKEWAGLAQKIRKEEQMAIYNVTATYTHHYNIEIEADSEKEAIKIAKKTDTEDFDFEYGFDPDNFKIREAYLIKE